MCRCLALSQHVPDSSTAVADDALAERQVLAKSWPTRWARGVSVWQSWSLAMAQERVYDMGTQQLEELIQ